MRAPSSGWWSTSRPGSAATSSRAKSAFSSRGPPPAPPTAGATDAGEHSRRSARRRRPAQIGAAVDAYVRDYSVPLVAAARRGDASAESAGSLDEGKRRVDEMRRSSIA